MSRDEALSVERFYSEGGKGKLLGLRCKSGHVNVPPRHSCRICGSSDLEVSELSGLGKIVSYTEVHSKSAGFPVDVPYNLVLVSLNEGGNLLGIIQSKDAISIEARVRVKFSQVNGREPKLSSEKGRPRIFFELE